MNTKPTKALILVLRPLEWFGIVTAELKRVDSLGQYMAVLGAQRSEHVDPADDALRQLAVLCEELQPDWLYGKYAAKQVYRRAADFWATKDRTVVTHVKRMADQRLCQAVSAAMSLDIPVLYAKESQTALHLTDRLHMAQAREVTPVMRFHRHDQGTTYRLLLRIDGRLVDHLAEHRLAVLSYQPATFVLDDAVYSLSDGFSSQLLLPFVSKDQVQIARRVENDYFQRFILRFVARAEIEAEGFDISDESLSPQARLTCQTAIDGARLLTLQFAYGTAVYTLDSKSNGRVTLTEADGTFRFVRQLRDRQQEQAIAHWLAQTTGAGPTVRLDSLSDMIAWLRTYAPLLKSHGIDVVQPSDHIYYIGPLSVEQNETWHGDWLQTDVTVIADDGRLRLPLLDLRDTLLRGEREYMLPTGERLLIPQEWLQRYTGLLLTGMPRGHGFQRHRSQVPAVSQSDAAAQGADSMATVGRQAIDAVLPPQLGRKEQTAVLRTYQLDGFQWLWQNFMAQTGCCLSDEMGLGKTIQTIALLLKYKETAQPPQTATAPMPGMLFSDEEMQGGATPHDADATGMSFRTSLVVAPASVVHNWRNELARFAPRLLVMSYTGDNAARREKRRALMRWDVVLTTYHTLLNDIAQIASHEFGIVVFDESQAFKTPSSLIHQAVGQLRALHRMALSGTPVENNLQELWSLMSVLNPHLLGDASSFRKAFADPIATQMEESRRELLRQLIAPYFLKRTKDEVLSDLPERQDEVVVCPMTDAQASLYAAELSKARNEWLDTEATGSHREMHMLAALQRLRKIANGEGKMAVVFSQLESLRATQHKVLLFSEYVSLLDEVGQEMARRSWTYAMLTGQTTQREEVIARFQQQADCQFFLISLKAGGVGLNLTAADYVFLLDPWWNRAAEEQAIARAHRIGQRRSVFVYRFVSAGTLEEQILTLQERKQSLIDSVMPFICAGK